MEESAVFGAFRRVPGREHTLLVVTAIVIGVLGAYGAIAFRYLIKGSHFLFFGNTEYTLEALESIPWLERLFLPAIGGLLVGVIVHKFADEVRGSGIPEVMESVARRGGAIRFRVVLAKAIAASLTIGSGGSVGREGPIAHIGSAIGSGFGQLFAVSPKRMRTFVACGSAAAIAATFNAPISGALFALEVVLGDMSVAAMSPIVISSVVATVISRHHLGDFPAFEVPSYLFVDSKELFFYAGLGIAAGIVAVIFSRTLYSTVSFFEKREVPEWSKPALGGLLVGIIALGFPHVFGVGYETINETLWGRTDALLLAAVMLAKIFATSFSLGSGGSGGIFAPSLFIGASLGASVGQIVHEAFPAWTAGPGAYALVGMGAVVSGATHAPITAILIMFELTNDYHIIPPLMLACVVAVLLSSQLDKDSIYTRKLTRRGINLSERKEVNLLRCVPVATAMQTEVTKIHAETPLTQLLSALIASPSPGAAVVDENENYLSMVELSDIREILPQSKDLGLLVVAADVGDSSVPFVVPDDNLDLVMHIFGRTNRQVLAVCEGKQSRKILGTLTRQAVIDAYNRRIFQEDLMGGFGSLLDAVGTDRTVEVLGGVHMGEVEARASWIGKTLSKARLRGRFGLEVLLIHRPTTPGKGVEGRPAHFPSPDFEIEAGDRLLVMGTAEAIRKARE